MAASVHVYGQREAEKLEEEEAVLLHTNKASAFGSDVEVSGEERNKKTKEEWHKVRDICTCRHLQGERESEIHRE